MNCWKIVTIFGLIILLFGCVSHPAGAPRTFGAGTEGSVAAGVTVYHTVGRGETLWRIAQRYNVDANEIVRVNCLKDVDSIEVGQRLTIPGGVAPVEPKKIRKKFGWPLKGTVVIRFGEKENSIVSKGIGIRSSLGADVVAAQSGTVTFVGERVKGYGKVIILDHGDGFETIYAHNQENLVALGGKVAKGDVIARVGSFGRAGYPYLHFEIRWQHQPQDPMIYLD
ncbi:MAG: LysM peptidoglycan-binding domain-containing M23 family metallopeptidase [Candidatus Omnitrophica bacterium]|nr:LysM peptidoglycan-binding domain-containing M23 family metallopeptidase [Candidatus Omnitrophota bacterium]